MIRFSSEEGIPTCVAETANRITIYLDNDSLIEIAKGNDERRRRFIQAIKCHSDLLFSLTNVLEITGPQGRSAQAVREFLNSIGEYWTPLEMNPFNVIAKEKKGLLESAAVSMDFMRAYVLRRLCDLPSSAQKLIDLGGEFFGLGFVMDWAQEHREEIRADSARLDSFMVSKFKILRVQYEKDPSSLDRAFPPIPFNPSRPASFALCHLIRMVVQEARAIQIKKNDGLDFNHAVLAAAYSKIASLDKQWKHRAEKIPFPAGFTRFFYRPEIEKLIDLFEKIEVQANL